LNDLILRGKDPHYLGEASSKLRMETFAGMSKVDKMATVAAKIKGYVSGRPDADKNRLHPLTLWVAADLGTEEGRAAARSALLHAK